MFEHITARTVIVTGPHRSGTTICAEMIGADTGKPVYREECFDYRDILKAESLVDRGGVIQGPYLLPWTPILDAHVVYMVRSAEDVQASVQRLRERGISTPLFSKDQADRLWNRLALRDFSLVEYESLKSHPLWVNNREGWGHRQTC